jgi:hypothetical protein
MWKIENGQRIEISEDILYMGELLVKFFNLISLGFISKDKIYYIYKEIMTLANRNDRIGALSRIEEKAQFEILERGKQANVEKIVASVMKNYQKTPKLSNIELEDKATIENLYDVAKVVRPSGTWCLYIFYMEMLVFDKDKRAKEVEQAYKQLCLEKFEKMRLLSKEEANKKIMEIGKSKLLEKVRGILKTEGETL